MSVFRDFVLNIFNISMPFFGYHVTFGQFFVFLWVVVIIVGFIKGLFR